MPDSVRACGCAHGPSAEDAKWYGVRSYLHLFYEDCANADELEAPPPICAPHPWPSKCWKITVSIATLLLLLGLAALTTGYAVPPRMEGLGEGEFLVLDQRAADYNQALFTCRLAGTILCGAAGILLAICLVWATTGWMSPEYKVEPLDSETEGQTEDSGDEMSRQLCPIFPDASAHAWFSPPPSPFGQSSGQPIPPPQDS